MRELGALILWTCAGGCDLLSALPGNPAGVTINIERVGCSPGSRSARFSATLPVSAGGIQWFFSDGTSMTGSEVIHTFEQRQNYSVTLVATLSDGSTARVQETFAIPAPGDGETGTNAFGDRCVPEENAQHVATGTDVTYLANPPASGPHYAAAGVAPIAEGFYETEIQPEVWVHNLEHGDVVFLYDCPGDCAADFLDDLRALFNTAPPRFGKRKLVITRFSGLGPFMMAVAWNTQRDFDQLDTDGLIDFYNRYVGAGPEDLP